MSMSKSVEPALRLAYIATPKYYMNDLKTALYNINISQSMFLMEMASRMIASKNVDKLVDERRQRIRKRNSLVNKYLEGYEIMGDDEVIFRWLILPEGIEAEQFQEKALKKEVKVYTGERFTVGNTKPIEAVRLAVAAPESSEELEKGLKILKELLEEK